MASSKQWKSCEGDGFTGGYDYTQTINNVKQWFEEWSSTSVEKPQATSSTPTVIEDVITVKLSTGRAFPIKQSHQKDVALDIEIADNPNPTAVQPACELAIILDRSGSMQGDSLENSKQAIIEIVNQLKADDIMHFITYHDTSAIEFSGLMTQENKRDITKRIQECATDGCTNIGAAIEDSVRAMFADKKTVAQEGCTNRRVFLFSDGEVNQGIQDRTELLTLVRSIQANFGVNFTAFGLGANFDEEVMRGIATEGKGDFFFIDGAQDISNKVNKGMHVFQSLYAINAKVNLFAASSNQISVLVDKVSGFGDNLGRAGVTVPVGDLCFDDHRQVLIFLQVDTSNCTASVGDSVEVLEYTLIYSVLQEDGSTKDFSKSGEVSVVLSDSAECLNDVPDSLKVARAISEASAADKSILIDVQNGEFETAIEKKKASISNLKSVLEIDTTGVVSLLINRAEVNLVSLESQSESVEKDIGYSAYQGGIVHRKCF